MKNNKIKKDKISAIIFFILIIAIILFIVFFIYDCATAKKIESDAVETIKEIDKIIEENKENYENINEKVENVEDQYMTAKINDKYVLGKIRIDKIKIEYPIIKYESEDSLWQSICKISNNNIDGKGNLCLAGHNMRNFTMFAKLKELEIGDYVEITNLVGQKYQYEVYEKKIINATDTSVLEDNENNILTMITCNGNSKKRLLIRAKII